MDNFSENKLAKLIQTTEELYKPITIKKLIIKYPFIKQTQNPGKFKGSFLKSSSHILTIYGKKKRPTI